MLLGLLATFLAALLLGIALGAAVRSVAPRLGAVVPARADRWHRSPTPTLGGVAITGAVLLTLGGVLLAGADSLAHSATAVLVAGTAFGLFLVGLADDRLQLLPLTKLLATLVAGSALLFGLHQLGGGGFTWWQSVIAIVWYAGVVHAFNLLDNMDGLAGGIGLVAALVTAVVYGQVIGQSMLALLAALAGGAAGFLVWNVKPARLFMGDCGSLFLGAVLAGVSLAILSQPHAGLALEAVVVGLILVVPLFDTSFVLVLRRLAGRSASRGGTDHLSHRLVSIGLSERSAVAALYVLALAGGACAYLVRTGGWGAAPIAALFAAAVLLLGIFLARVPAYDGEDFQALQKASYAPFLKDLAFRWHALEMLLDVVLISAVYYLSYRLRFEDERFDMFLPSFTASLPVVLGCKLVALHVSGAYSRMWGTFGIRDLFTIVRGVLIGSGASVLVVAYLYRFERFSRGVFIIDAALLILVLAAARGSFRMMGEAAISRNTRGRRVLIYGAGSGGQLLVREMRANAAWAMLPIAFLDDDPAKYKLRVLGVPVKGTAEDVEEVIRHYRVDEVVLSTTALEPARERKVRHVCERLRIPVRRFRLEITD